MSETGHQNSLDEWTVLQYGGKHIKYILRWKFLQDKPFEHHESIIQINNFTRNFLSCGVFHLTDVCTEIHFSPANNCQAISLKKIQMPTSYCNERTNEGLTKVSRFLGIWRLRLPVQNFTIIHQMLDDYFWVYGVPNAILRAKSHWKKKENQVAHK